MIHRALLLLFLFGVGYVAVGKFGIEHIWLSSEEEAAIATAKAQESIVAYKEALEHGEGDAFASLFNEGAFEENGAFPGKWEKEVPDKDAPEVEITKSFIQAETLAFEIEKKWTDETTGEEKKEKSVVVGEFEKGNIVAWNEYQNQSPYIQSQGSISPERATEIYLTPEQTLASYCQLLSQH